MQKRHFVAAAKQVKEIEDRQLAFVVAHNFAVLFSSFNPLFDRFRFMSACGL